MNPLQIQGREVGKRVANCRSVSANWIQLANACQLEFHTNQGLAPKLAMLAVGNAANLPTDASTCFERDFPSTEVGEISLSYYVGEGTDVPSVLRAEFPPGPWHGRPATVRTTILALDLGTMTGWAMRDREGMVTSGTESFKPHRFEGGGMRFLRFKRWLAELKACANGIDLVVFEEVRRHAGVDAAHAYGGFMAHLTAWCEHHRIPYQGVPVGTIKRHATGKGNASKTEVIEAMRARGHTPGDDNEADALALLHWAIENGEA